MKIQVQMAGTLLVWTYGELGAHLESLRLMVASLLS